MVVTTAPHYNKRTPTLDRVGVYFYFVHIRTGLKSQLEQYPHVQHL